MGQVLTVVMGKGGESKWWLVVMVYGDCGAAGFTIDTTGKLSSSGTYSQTESETPETDYHIQRQKVQHPQNLTPSHFWLA